MKDRKPRASEIRIDFGREQVLSGMDVSEDGVLKFFDEDGEVVAPENIGVGSAYARAEKQPKVLTRATAEPVNIQLDPNRALSRFDFVFAVDTNTKQIGTVKVSVSASVLITHIEIGETRWDAKLVPQDPVEFHQATAPPERIGWWETIKRITSHREVSGPIALIVDSDLDKLDAFNCRHEPILDGQYLPDGIQLLYGCGDRGTQEFIANAAIADCDREASRVLARISDGVSGEYFVAEGAPYTRFRYWVPTSIQAE